MKDDQLLFWQKNIFNKTLQEMGLKAGDTFIDYGCGVGNYTKALSYFTGENGIVYAIDINKYVLNEVNKINKGIGLNNVKTMLVNNQSLDIKDNSVDCIMIYDLIHYLIYDEILDDILKECYRVLNDNGILSIIPFHMSQSQITDMINELDKNGFVLSDTYNKKGLHFEMHRYSSNNLDNYEKGDIYNFKKNFVHDI